MKYTLLKCFAFSNSYCIALFFLICEIYKPVITNAIPISLALLNDSDNIKNANIDVSMGIRLVKTVAFAMPIRFIAKVKKIKASDEANIASFNNGLIE